MDKNVHTYFRNLKKKKKNRNEYLPLPSIGVCFALHCHQLLTNQTY